MSTLTRKLHKMIKLMLTILFYRVLQNNFHKVILYEMTFVKQYENQRFTKQLLNELWNHTSDCIIY